MTKPVTMSWQTRQNWLIDAAVFLGALLASLSGFYFLILPTGGYQGGRNALYGVIFLFGRPTWDDLHTWGGILMIAAVAVHFAIHWAWVKGMGRRVALALRGQSGRFSRGAKVNIILDLTVALSFLVTAVSGLYFLALPAGYQGGRTPGWDPAFLFSRATWDLIHTWAAVVMIVAAVLHLAIHWRWVVKVTQRFFLSLRPASRPGKRANAAVS